jgi:hypothetical protein
MNNDTRSDVSSCCIMALFFEMEENDFETIIKSTRRTNGFTALTDDCKYGVDDIRHLFKPKHIPKLLEFLKKQYSWKFFELIWDTVDQQNIEVLADFFLSRYVIAQNEIVMVTNRFQLRIAVIVTDYCKENFCSRQSNVKKCLVFQCGSPSKFNEFIEVTEFQKEALLFLTKQLSPFRWGDKVPAAEGIFKGSDAEYRLSC